MRPSLWSRFVRSKPPSARSRATRPARRLGLEPLEERMLLAVITDVSPGFDRAFAGAVTASGAILSAGSQDGMANAAVVRHLPTGVLDTSFSGDGKFSFDFGGLKAEVVDLELQSDGKIVAGAYSEHRAGSSPTGVNSRFALARISPDGTLDKTFGSKGKVTTTFGNTGNAFLNDVVIQPDGKILAAGSTTSTGQGNVVALARYTASGGLDSSFGSGGKVTTNLAPGADGASAVLVSGSYIYVAGTVTVADWGDQLAVVRYTANGSLDTSFGSGGIVHYTFFNIASPSRMALQSDGKIVIVGGPNMWVSRINPDGSLDSGFAGVGYAYTDGWAKEVMIQTDGRILAVGAAGSYDAGAVRYNADGTLDAGFGAGGIALAGETSISIEAGALQADGKVLAFGHNLDLARGVSESFAMVRWNSDGSVDTGFGGTAIAAMTDVATPPSTAPGHVRARHYRPADIERLVTRQLTSRGDGASLRAAADSLAQALAPSSRGSKAASSALSPEVKVAGLVTTSFGSPDDLAVAGLVAPNGDLLSAGGTANPSAFAYTRHSSTGVLLASGTTVFGGDWDGASSILLQPDGKIVLGGNTWRLTGVFGTKYSGGFALARYNADGSLDNTFGAKGKVTTNFGKDLAGIGNLVLQPDGKILALGYLDTTESNIAMARYNPNGSLDKSFGTSGKVVGPAGSRGHGLALQGTKILVGGYALSGGIASDFMVRRFNANGSVDTSFGTNGIVVTDIGSPSDAAVDLAIQADGKIIASGQRLDGSGDFVVARYSADGVLDTSFGGGVGFVTTDTGGDDRVDGLAIQPDGTILVGGRTNNWQPAIVRYLTDGTLDSTFGIGGVATAYLGIYTVVQDLRLQSDGKIVLFGIAELGGPTTHDYDFALIRYLPNGTLDSGF